MAKCGLTKVGVGFELGLSLDISTAKVGGPRKSMLAVHPCKSKGDMEEGRKTRQSEF